ncbi:hypothetical protein [Halopelagius longus]|uniref:DUF8149 domain-containing protein n=1 Tax=Halopelagius longus TaxID=1236180 RepID=A0A1H1BKR5_9EURY|nr:hypothetical protein [Halopelagius longus]RDI70825.1 hypothetical protein DWB78_03270 [Halopelagius longus]SDQ52538.1 hypothetical protein SAMN05216278_1842 [Halopelagius longus]
MTGDSDEEPRVPIVCDECETTSRVPLPDVADAIAKHNDRLHDGDDVAGIDPEIVRHVTDLAAEDLGLTGDGE